MLTMTSSRRVAPEEVPEYPGPIGSAASTLPLLDGQHQEIGGRKQQEDACCRIPDLNNVVAKLRPELGILARRAFYAVYDGFSGPFVSTWLARNLHEVAPCRGGGKVGGALCRARQRVRDIDYRHPHSFHVPTNTRPS